jgi:hypothetical protein
LIAEYYLNTIRGNYQGVNTVKIDEQIGSSWLCCFKKNQIFRAYCAAKVAGNADDCIKVEQEYENISQLYEDWGDIRNISHDADSESFKKWSRSRYDLIAQYNHMWWIDNKERYRYKTGNLLVNIPLLENKTDTLRKVKTLLDLVYAARNNDERLNILTDNAKLMFGPLKEPPYKLHGELNITSAGRLKKAVYVGSMDRNLSLADTIVQIKQHRGNPFGWSLSPEEAETVRDGTFKSIYVSGSTLAVTISKCRSEFDSLVRNTIFGRFPDYS